MNKNIGAMIEKSYRPEGLEEKWYNFWLRNDYFKAESKSRKPSYCIVIPPPNVTGSLHIGHALDITLQDIIIRWKRMSGFNTLWLPGTDHAGIATQNVVEKELSSRGVDRHDLGREKFIEKVWEWKRLYGGTIINQLKRMGASCDWSRERFTLDEGLSRAVREVFIRLYGEGLIYRGDYIINWCPRCHTALSDLEVEHEEKKGKLWYIKYRLKDGDGYITVATTRPETYLGDTAVAVNPGDKRYKNSIGRSVVLPVVNREIPVIEDEFVDSSFGTGAVKVTPAHDPNDFEIARRHNLPFILIMTGDGKMTGETGPYRGQDRFECRKNVLKDLESSGNLEKVTDHDLSIGHCYRCKTIIEPYLSKQWFVKIDAIAKEAIEAVRDGRVKIIPSGWENSYFDWMENIRDWCISRQIWWGHRIPVWYCQALKNDECIAHNGINVSSEEPGVCMHCGSSDLKQDEDVLDTWFSSALWPFSTLGWPEETDDLRSFYPTDVLITGFDILFFWVARMIMMGMKFMKREPFRHTYIHALIRDESGHKMSKSKGNVVDPLEMTEVYGTDAFRFTLTAMAAQGRDIRFSVKRVEGYRHFINKIWNAGRFILANVEDKERLKPVADITHSGMADRWILSRLSSVAKEVNDSLEEYRFNDAASILYQFVWHEFCDWYLEVIKTALKPVAERDFFVLSGKGNELRESAISTAIHVFEVILGLLHPFVPFVTEELWHYLPSKKIADSLCVRAYPTESEGFVDEIAESEMKLVMDAVLGIRSIRGELNISPSLDLKAIIKTTDEKKNILSRNVSYISRLAKTSSIEIGCNVGKPDESAVSVRPSMEIFVPLKGIFDVEAEVKRLSKEMDKYKATLSMIQKKLSNEDFIRKAPDDVVDKNKAKCNEIGDKIQTIHGTIEKLRKLG
jgi:valyl-tRNA synthetase